ncbi:hypothetical protein GTA08_BOTSDO11651 [Neofusicoccum parvum]|nr:hypothetical protein GTA08_BOTSDO11651 [Neofusicoccum parvum]
MKNTFIALSALAGTALSTPLVTGIDFAQVNEVVATAITTGAPVIPTATATYAQSSAITEASADASTVVASALQKRFYKPTSCSTSTTSSSTSSSSSSSSSVAVSSSAATTTAASTSAFPYCTSLATGAGAIPTPDTASAFLAYAPFHASASAAAATAVPTNYLSNFTDLNGATQLSSYLTYKTMDTYSAQTCADFCDATSLCTSFNIYFERDPSMDGNDDVCMLSTLPSTTNIKCALFGGSVSSDSATNTGQWRNQFQVVITGSNGYNKKPAVVTPPDCNKGSKNNGWKSGTKCSGGGAIIKAGALMGQRFFSGPYDPSLCAAYAEAQVAINKKSASIWTLWRYQPCNSFNAYAVIKNKKTVGTYCSLFNVDVTASTSTYFGGKSGQDTFAVDNSNVYACKTYDNGYNY